jgi:PAS domain-containing protein
VSTVDRLAAWIGEMLAHHMLEATSDPVVVLNADQRVVLLNRAASSLGWNRQAVIGREWGDMLHPDDQEPDAPVSPPGTDAPIVRRGEVTLRLGDGTWQRAAIVSYAGRIDDHGVVSVLVLKPHRIAC